MKQYRVTKYNSENRQENDKYQEAEWISFSDIGQVLTAEQYYEVEQHYIQICIAVWEKQGSNLFM